MNQKSEILSEPALLLLAPRSTITTYSWLLRLGRLTHLNEAKNNVNEAKKSRKQEESAGFRGTVLTSANWRVRNISSISDGVKLQKWKDFGKVEALEDQNISSRIARIKSFNNKKWRIRLFFGWLRPCNSLQKWVKWRVSARRRNFPNRVFVTRLALIY